MSLADIQSVKILNLLKQNVYNVANLTKTSYIGNYAPIAFRDMNIGGRSNAYATATSRLQIFPRFTVQDIVIGYGNYYNGVTASPNGSIGNSITVKASLEINGSLIPVTFNGSRTVTISSPSAVMSDPVPCIISPSDTVYIRTYYDTGGGYAPQCPWMFTGNGVNDGFISGQDYTDSGTFPASTFVQSYTPQWIIGATPTKRDSVLLLGDSIISGTNDGPQASAGHTGFASRALTNQGIGWNKVSMGGENSAGCLNSLYVRRPYFNYHNKVIVNYGRNDLNPTCTLPSIQGWLLKIWQYLSGLGLTVYQTTIAPSTTSTDNFTSIANQSLQSGTAEPVRLQLNAWLRDTSSNGAIAQSNGALYKVMDVAQAVEDPATGKWKIYNNGNPIFTGTATSGNSSSLTCSSLPYASRQLDNTTVIKITGGTGAGQTASVNNNNTATQISINGTFNPAPDATSTFALYTVPTYDGVHPSQQAHIDMSEYVVL